MLSGTVPFKANNMKDLHKLIKQGVFTYSVDISKGSVYGHHRLDAKNLIENLLKLKPEERLTVPEILAHPWLKDDDLENEVFLGKEECASPTGETNGQPDINNVTVDNLFFKDKSTTKLSYPDYCYIANDFYTHHMGNLVLLTT